MQIFLEWTYFFFWYKTGKQKEYEPKDHAEKDLIIWLKKTSEAKIKGHKENKKMPDSWGHSRLL